MAVAATLNTPAERERHARILQTAEAMLAQGDLQMKTLAHRADVALATLYRYFPSKDHVLGAIALERHRRALQRLDNTQFEGDTAGKRAGDMMVREFRSVQREPEMAAALGRITSRPDRSTSEYMEGIRQIMVETILAAVEQDGQTASDEQRRVLPIFMAATSGAINHWLSGLLSAAETRAQIRTAGRLFDLPAEIMREYLWID
jgi:AcrR family transcriptional regulator